MNTMKPVSKCGHADRQAKRYSKSSATYREREEKNGPIRATVIGVISVKSLWLPDGSSRTTIGTTTSTSTITAIKHTDAR